MIARLMMVIKVKLFSMRINVSRINSLIDFIIISLSIMQFFKHSQLTTRTTWYGQLEMPGSHILDTLEN